MTPNSLQQGLECQAGNLRLLIFEVFARLSTRYSSQVAYCGSEAIVVVSPGLQADDSEVDAINTAYFNINIAICVAHYAFFSALAQFALRSMPVFSALAQFAFANR